MSIKEKLQSALYKLRNPERSEEDAEFNKSLGFKRLLFFLPFLIAAAIILLLSLR